MVHSIENIPWTRRQMITLTMQVHRKGEQRVIRQEEAIIIKLMPGTRRKEMLGLKGRRDLESVNMISDDEYLLKFCADNS